jgi:hypothetical protein
MSLADVAIGHGGRNSDGKVSAAADDFLYASSVIWGASWFIFDRRAFCARRR